ncbi:MAG: methyltransferase domain-containing protein [Terriglobales bacterium]
MKPALLNWLVCPQCKGALTLRAPAEGKEIEAGDLDCSVCRAAYPIVRGVPRMLFGELAKDKERTASAFGYEWTHFTELTDQYRQEFLEWIEPVQPEFFRDKVILDAGCGKGRHAELSARFGAREVIAVDLSDAVESAYANTRNLPNVHVVQGDIYHLPFLRPFDYAYSIGVLHHLPDPGRGFASVCSHLKTGGRVSAWVYGAEGNGWIARFIDPLRIHVTSRAPKWITRAVSFLFALPLYVGLKLVYGPASSRPGLRKHLFYSDYLCAISNYSFAENYWNVFDHLVAPTAFYLRRDEVEAWFRGGAFHEVEIAQHHGNSWRATATVTDVAAPAAPDLHAAPEKVR